MRDSKARVTMETDDGGKLKGETPSMQPIRLFFLTFLCFTQLFGSSLPSELAE